MESVGHAPPTGQTETFAHKVKVGLQKTAQKVSQFVQKHRALLFFGASALFCLIAAPAYAKSIAVLPVLLAGALTAVALQTVASIVGAKGFTSQATQKKVDALMGALNLGSHLFHPAAGVAMAVYTCGAHLAGKGIQLINSRFETA